MTETNYFKKSVNDYNPQNLEFTFDTYYYINTQNVIGLYTVFNSHTDNWEGESLVEVRNSNSTPGYSRSNQTTSEKYDFWSFNPYHEYRWNDKASDYLRTDIRFIRYQSDENSIFRLIEQEALLIDQPNTQQGGKSDLYNFQVDFSKKLNNFLHLKSGLKYDQTQLSSSFRDLTQVSLQNFGIDEEIIGAYSQVKYVKSQLSAQVGLRWEYSVTEGFDIDGVEKNTREISQLFPSLSLSYPLSDKIEGSFSYSYRINRPNYGSLNPFEFYYDPLLSDAGNPQLKPEFTHSFRLALITENNINLSTSYRRATDDIFEFVEQNQQTNGLIRRLINIDQSEYLVFNVGTQYNVTSRIELSTDISARYQSYNADGDIFKHNNSRWSYVLNQDFSISLPRDLEFEAGCWIASGRLNGLMETDWYSGAYASLAGTFWNDQFQLSLDFEDLVARGFRHNIDFGSINAEMANQWTNYNLFFRMKYSFGNRFVKTTDRKRKSSGIERLE